MLRAISKKYAEHKEQNEMLQRRLDGLEDDGEHKHRFILTF
jgi:hypothetical protein